MHQSEFLFVSILASLFHEEWFRNDFCSTENDFGTIFVLQNTISSIEYFLKDPGTWSNLDHKIRVLSTLLTNFCSTETHTFLFYGSFLFHRVHQKAFRSTKPNLRPERPKATSRRFLLVLWRLWFVCFWRFTIFLTLEFSSTIL